MMDGKMVASVKIEQPKVDLEYAYVHNSARETLTGVQLFDKTDSKILSSIKIEQPEADLEYPDVHSSTKDIIDEGHTFYMTDKEIPSAVNDKEMPSAVKTEPGVYLEYPNLKPVKQELPTVLCEDKTHKLGKMIDTASCCIFPYMVGNGNTDPTMTESDYKVLFDLENCSHGSKNATSVTEINRSPFLTDKNCESDNPETVVNHAQISRGSLDFTADSANSTHPKTQTRYLLDGNDPRICEEKASQKVEKTDKQQVSGDAVIKTDHLKHCARAQNEEKLHSCDNCITPLTQNANIYVHMKMLTGEQCYKCDICGTQRTHTGEKPYKCDVCQAFFNQTSHLKRHKSTHTGEKPYKCDVCEASFNQTSDVKYHKRIHTGEKPYKCDVCEASFNCTSHLKRYKRTHTREKPYKCDVCGATFSQNYLEIHKRTHTGKEPYKCDICEESFKASSALTQHKKNTYKTENIQM